MSAAADPPILQFIRNALGRDQNGPPDADLLDRFVSGKDNGAFELLVWRHGGMVFGVCRAILHDHHASEDAAQAVFLALARGAKSIRGERAVVGWLHRVAGRIAKRAARRLARDASLKNSAQGTAALASKLPTTIPADNDSIQALHEEVGLLPEKYRLPILLCYFEGLSYPEAAKRLNWPVGSLNSRISRAKALLQRRLLSRGVTLPAAGFAVLSASETSRAVTNTFVENTVRASIAYAAKEAIIPSVSNFSVQLADGALKSLLLQKVQIVAGLFAVLGIMLGGTAILAGNGNGVIGGDNAISLPMRVDVPEISRGEFVLAPVRENPESFLSDRAEFAPIDPDQVSECEVDKVLTYGEFEKGDEFWAFPQSFHVNCDQGSGGLPGFLWPVFSKEDDQPHIVESLAAIKVPFGLVVTDTRKSADKEFAGVESSENLVCLKMTEYHGSLKDFKLSKFKNLRILMLPEHADDSTLEDLANLEHLEVLDLTRCYKVTPKGLNRLANLKRLHAFIPPRVARDRAAAEWYEKIQNFKNLQVLHDVTLKDENLERVTTLRKLSALKMSQITDASFERLASLESLVSLDADGGKISGSGLAKLKHLRTLILRGTELSDEGFRELAKLKGLQTLCLEGPKLTVNGFRSISELRNLRSLDIKTLEVSNEGMESLLKLDGLTTLSIGRVQTGVQSAEKLKSLKTMFHMEKLKSLKIAASSIPDAELEYLEKMPNLKSLYLSSDKLTDESLKQIGKLTNLQDLTIEGKISNAGLKHLYGLKNVKTLDIRSDVSLSALKALQRRLPLCRRMFRFGVDDLWMFERYFH